MLYHCIKRVDRETYIKLITHSRYIGYYAPIYYDKHEFWNEIYLHSDDRRPPDWKKERKKELKEVTNKQTNIFCELDR